MKKLLSLILLCSGLSLAVQATEVNQTALKLEQKFLEIAAILAEVHNVEGPCNGEIEAYTSEIVDNLRKARQFFNLNDYYNLETKRDFVPPESVRTAVGDTLAYRELLGTYNLNDAASLTQALAGVVLYGPAPGAFGNTTAMSFKEGGKLVYGWLEFEGDGTVWKETEGTFEVAVGYEGSYGVKRVVTVMVNDVKRTYLLKDYFQSEGYNSNTLWHLIPENAENPNPYFEGFVDYPSECEA